MKKKLIVVIDGQGGNIGKQLVKDIKDNIENVTVRAIGTNSIATGNMLKGGADEAATGENALIVACRQADVIVGPVGIAIPESLLGEVTTKMAEAVGSSGGKKVLIPFNKCDVNISGVKDKSTSELINEALDLIRDII